MFFNHYYQSKFQLSVKPHRFPRLQHCFWSDIHLCLFLFSTMPHRASRLYAETQCRSISVKESLEQRHHLLDKEKENSKLPAFRFGLHDSKPRSSVSPPPASRSASRPTIRAASASVCSQSRVQLRNASSAKKPLQDTTNVKQRTPSKTLFGARKAPRSSSKKMAVTRRPLAVNTVVAASEKMTSPSRRSQRLSVEVSPLSDGDRYTAVLAQETEIEATETELPPETTEDQCALSPIFYDCISQPQDSIMEEDGRISVVDQPLAVTQFVEAEDSAQMLVSEHPLNRSGMTTSTPSRTPSRKGAHSETRRSVSRSEARRSAFARDLERLEPIAPEYDQYATPAERAAKRPRREFPWAIWEALQKQVDPTPARRTKRRTRSSKKSSSRRPSRRPSNGNDVE